MSTPRLEITPTTSLLGEPIAMRAVGCRPGAHVQLIAEAHDADEYVWSSRAVFVADPHGLVDVAQQAPMSGTYASADAFGLFWSMEPARESDGFAWGNLDGFSCRIVLLVDETPVDEVVVTRNFVSPDVERTDVRDDGLYGAFFRPSHGKDLPAIVILGGSEGGLDERLAGLFASRGFATLALAYFGIGTLPKVLADIPLEYCHRAIEWLQQRPEINGERVGVLGGSKGGELALLLGATFPSVRAVVAHTPSSVVWQGFSFQPPRSSWSHNDQPLPFVPFRTSFTHIVNHLFARLFHKSVALQSVYCLRGIDAKQLEEATIPVENSHGPIMLISGGDDQMWPARPFAEMSIDRLAAHKYPHAYEHLTYADAGHAVYGLPDVPLHGTTGTKEFTLGGTVQANATARADAWPRVLRFFRTHLLGSPVDEK